MESPVAHENYFDRYTKLVSEKNITEAFSKQDQVLNDFLAKVSEEKANYAYAEGKWTLKEMLQHLIDAERVFCYRAMCIARKETVNLPGFDENEYADNSGANSRSWASLAEEMKALRSATKLMFASFTEEMLHTTGKFNNTEGQAGRLGFITIGHTYHHIKIVEERYL
jgi:uncharacterized damage-inducible protein DinB